MPRVVPSHAPIINAIASLVRQIPHELIALPIEKYAVFMEHIGRMEFQLNCWTHRDSAPRFIYSDHIVTIRNALASCPDEYPPESTAELSFIADQDLRKSIRGDIGAAERAFVNGEWKAATVLAGEVIEALLHWKLVPHVIESDVVF